MPSFANGSRPYITIHIMGTDGTFHPIRGILDSGNDITLLMPSAAQELGLTGQTGNGTFNVKGIGEKPMVFQHARLLMKVQDAQPVWIRAGAQIQQRGDDALRDNLFGRKDLLDNFDIVMSKGSIELHQTGGGASNSLGLSLPKRPVGDEWQYRSDVEDSCPFSNCA